MSKDTSHRAPFHRMSMNGSASISSIAPRHSPIRRGWPLGSWAYRPQELYHTVTDVRPALLVYFGDLHWRSVGSVGMAIAYTFENNIGPDEAKYGIRTLHAFSNLGQVSEGDSTVRNGNAQTRGPRDRGQEHQAHPAEQASAPDSARGGSSGSAGRQLSPSHAART